MPRTSYGDDKRKQSWRIIKSLLQKKHDSSDDRLMFEDLMIIYHDWEAQGSPSIEVKGTLASLSALCGENFSIEQVRESLNEHLSSRFLKILQDNRKRKAGRGADQWHFKISLWSIQIEENEEKFNTLWESRRPKQEKDSGRLRGRLQDVVASENRSNDNPTVSRLESVLAPYEDLVQEFVTTFNENFIDSSLKSISEANLRKGLLEIIRKVSDSDAVILYELSKKTWQPKYNSGDEEDFYTQLIFSNILILLKRDEVFANDSHGIIIEFDGKMFSVIPLETTNSSSPARTSILILCNFSRNSIFKQDPVGRIISAFYTISKESLCQSIDNLESSVLDALKKSFRFVSLNLYNRRFELFCKQLFKMTVYFQAIVKLEPALLEAWEALARDPATMRAPVELFSAAELWGVKFLTELDLYFLRKSTQLYYEARVDTNKNRYHDILPLAVNVYPDSLMRSAYLQEIRTIIDKKILPAGKLILEISEKSALPQVLNWNDDKPTWFNFREHLKEYARQGTRVKFAIDDFGVGHASVSRLIGLRLEYVKIDQEVLGYEPKVRDSVIQFVRDALLESSGNAPHIVLEGVDEKYPLYSILDSNTGAQSIQGFLIGKASEKIYDRLNETQYKALQKQKERVT
ncbi:MAG: EAL domain-containing protein [Alkalinema sp. RU_4_3]|nr:EAL domain-containing protein [Alkalinema sp. RU_4_3]